MIPSLFPLFDFSDHSLHDGTEVKATSFCKENVPAEKCTAHYSRLQQLAAGYHQCPFGFTTRTFFLDGRRWAMTGVVAFPRFNSDQERRRAKHDPQNKIARDSMERQIRHLQEVSGLKAKIVQEAAQVLPQALHELRKLNREVLQYTEKEIAEHGENRNRLTVRGAAELMRNNFDILESLANIDGITALPLGDTIHVFDLAFKMKRIYQETAGKRKISINVQGAEALIHGSQKLFPSVPAILIENAIKYGAVGSVIHVGIREDGADVLFIVENESDHYIDPVACFDRGERFVDKVEGAGFGLFLAREIVHAHKGTIKCEVNGGTVRMIVRLPLYKVVKP